jgi:hypothetical protein
VIAAFGCDSFLVFGDILCAFLFVNMLAHNSAYFLKFSFGFDVGAVPSLLDIAFHSMVQISGGKLNVTNHRNIMIHGRSSQAYIKNIDPISPSRNPSMI